MLLRTEIRRDYTTTDRWVEVDINGPGFNEPPGPTTETVAKRLRPLVEGETIESLRQANKYVALAQANPYIWVTEE